MKGFIETDYNYKEGWQWQKIYVHPGNFIIIRSQNYKNEEGNIVEFDGVC